MRFKRVSSEVQYQQEPNFVTRREATLYEEPRAAAVSLVVRRKNVVEKGCSVSTTSELSLRAVRHTAGFSSSKK